MSLNIWSYRHPYLDRAQSNLAKASATDAKRASCYSAWRCQFFRVVALTWLLILSASVTAGQQLSVLVLGDSLSAAYNLREQQGWVHLLNQYYDKQQLPIRLINASISGETTDGGLQRLPALLDRHQPDVLYLELGANDGLRGHNPRKIEANLSRLVELATASGAKVVLQAMEIPTNYGNRYLQLFREAFERVSEQHNITMIPFFMKNVALNPDLMMNDGLHPNADGQLVIKEFMSKRLTDSVLNANEQPGNSHDGSNRGL